ncbi:NAD-dependent epimerase/dehydratase family protein [Actinoplanes sp. TBRC 11911]|uniref:dTDP-glucose 4,6-dehydratase n=1 Tax=Actinoplanes sp. TBRC 11911 TaxID=2729386 RepID=UPI00145D266F|nr:GDP-mannose 4,6-dehydratase [Actinoplanes sp. TBRC 11911]NMO53502.1 NAD-dependent epimerase/dehydratase family protein [Actinoplanes sp. TBRC 11911]
MKLLVTGGAGFLGSHFVRAVLADRLPGLQGATVTVLDNLSYVGAFANLGAVAENNRLDFMPGDVTDAPVVRAAVRGHDAIVHFAAATPAAGGEILARANALGTQVLLDAAIRHDVGRFVQVSGGRVYGSIDDGAWDETTSVTPVTPYAATKAGGDLLALASHRTHGLPVVVTRAADTYGPRQHLTATIPRAVIHLLDGRTVPLASDGGAVREWLHADDHCRALALALSRGRAGEIYHIGGSVELSDRDLIGEILQELGAGWDRVAVGPEPPAGRYALDDGKIRRELGWQPEVEFLTGLSATVRWYRQNPDWWRPLLYY